VFLGYIYRCERDYSDRKNLLSASDAAIHIHPFIKCFQEMAKTSISFPDTPTISSNAITSVTIILESN
jgi:hypothetical protein